MTKYIITGVALIAIIGIVIWQTDEPVGNALAQTINVNGKIIPFEFTDSNIGEDLIIRTDKMTYGGWEQMEVLFSIENISGADEDVNIQMYFDKTEAISEIYEFVEDVTYQRTVNDYSSVDYSCKDDWVASTTPSDFEETTDGYACGVSEFRTCDSVVKTTCTIDKVLTGNHQVDYFVDEWHSLPIVSAIEKDVSAKIPVKYIRDTKTATYPIKDTETKYFKALVDIPKKDTGEFWIGVFGSSAKGYLDPWYDSNYTYCKKITVLNTQIATTTTSFPILASSTDADLKSTGNGGKVESATGDDIIFVAGTDCNDDAGSLLNYEQEKYASTTGQFHYWVETDISSTTDKYMLMYYGNSGASDQSNAQEVWAYGQATSTAGVWHLSETDIDGGAGDIKDSTSNNNDGTTDNMDTNDQVASFIDGGFDFDGASPSGDGVTSPDTATLSGLSAVTASVWINWDSIGDFNDFHFIIAKSNAADNREWRLRTEFDGDTLVWQISNDGNDPGSAENSLDFSDNFSTGVWYHIVGTYDDGNSDLCHLYINGVLEDTDTCESGGTFDGSSNFSIGTAGNVRSSGGANFSTNGQIDEARVYNIALHAMDILTNYNCDYVGCVSFGSEETETAGEAGVAGKGNIILFSE